MIFQHLILDWPLVVNPVCSWLLPLTLITSQPSFPWTQAPSPLHVSSVCLWLFGALPLRCSLLYLLPWGQSVIWSAKKFLPVSLPVFSLPFWRGDSTQRSAPLSFVTNYVSWSNNSPVKSLYLPVLPWVCWYVEKTELVVKKCSYCYFQKRLWCFYVEGWKDRGDRKCETGSRK